MKQTSLYVFILALFLSLLSAQAMAVLRLESSPDGDIIDLEVGKNGVKRTFFLDNPPRLVIDIPLPDDFTHNTTTTAFSLPSGYNGNLVKAVRSGRFDEQTLRIVFDLARNCQITGKAQQGRIFTISIAEAEQKSAENAPAIRFGSKNPDKSSKTKVTKKELPLIVIDPGHGGEDPGAIGPRATQEKDIVLAFAKALKSQLLKSGKYRVLLTRESDVFIPLRERVKIAKTAKGNIFISLHADSAPGDEARGLSIYTLSEKASDAQTAALAEKENKVDILGGIDLSNEREDVADILISLAQRETRNQSALLADMLVIELGKNVRMLNNPHRFAGFAVLKSPDIPSVLIETGFISHPGEEKLLKTRQYRERLVEGAVKGIDLYFSKQK